MLLYDNKHLTCTDKIKFPKTPIDVFYHIKLSQQINSQLSISFMLINLILYKYYFKSCPEKPSGNRQQLIEFSFVLLAHDLLLKREELLAKTKEREREISSLEKRGIIGKNKGKREISSLKERN